MASISRFRARLDQLFPPDHPDTPWLLRLAIIRDDLAHELHLLSADHGDRSTDATWRHIYAARRIVISIGEAKNIFAYEIPGRLAADDLASVPGFVEAFEEGRRAVEKSYEILKPIRDGIGGHVRPKNAVQDRGPDPTPDAIRAFGGDIFEVHLDEETGRATNLRHLTASAFLFVWPDVKNYDQYIRKYHELVDQLEKSLTPILHGIDVLLCLHWIAAGIEPGYTR